ncbi:MAG TPA: cupin domain-containing protein [Candidatus Acidoferrum sp.]|jgi:oxalate decarboxylase|nr:cupin domain-containing protein [Candidatus Acidoferrum sp.]
MNSHETPDSKLGSKAEAKSILSRRDVLGAASLAALGATFAAPGAWSAASHQATAHQQYSEGRAPGKHEPIPDFKYDIESSVGWVGEAGSAKEATIEEFPISKSIAGVSMRLKPGGIRELHWHAVAAEWAYVITGRVRTTVINPEGQASVDDFEPGDIWYFPKGHGHSIQCLGPDDAHFILGFDDGQFSEFGTFSITDWLGHTSPEVLARNLNLSLETVKSLPKMERYIVPGTIPTAGPEPLRSASLAAPQSAHKFRLGAMKPIEFPGGTERVVSSKEFPIQTTLTSVLQDLNPGALRELHWHPNADEWQFYLKGRSRVTIFGAHGRSRTEEFGPGNIAFIPQGFGHCVEQIGSEPTRLVVLFNSPVFQEISISSWLAGNPPTLVADNLGLKPEQVAKLPRSHGGILA